MEWAPQTDRVRRAMAGRLRAQHKLEAAREELHAAIADAIAAGVRQTDLVTMTGYTRERIRQITREHDAERVPDSG